MITLGRRTAPPVDRPLRTVSLRRRVAVWVLLLLVVVLTVMGLVVNWLLGDALKSDLTHRLQDKASYAAVLQEQGVAGQTLADQMTGNGVLGLFNSGGRAYIGHDEGPPFSGSAGSAGSGGPVGQGGPGGVGRVRPPRPIPAVAPTVSVTEANGQMIATVTLPNGTLTLSAGEGEITNTLDRLQQVELLAGGGTLLVAGLLLITVVRAALRPLERMTALAQRIRDGTRGRRLRPTRPNTDLGRTATAFDDMLDALETAETQARSAEEKMRQFLGDASHDLRTPLAGVIAGAEQLLRTPTARAEREERLVQVVRQARRAARLVDDLLLMTRLDTAAQSGEQAGPAGQWQPTDPIRLIRREICLLELRRPDLTVVVGDGPEALVPADSDQLQRALGNLIENAATATPLGGVISIGRSFADGRLSIRVIDTGAGVPPEHRERIFDRFVRLSSSRSSAGSGLGLPISRAIARAAGGDLQCLPSSRGACFELTLPAVIAARPAVPADRQLTTAG